MCPKRNVQALSPVTAKKININLKLLLFYEPYMLYWQATFAGVVNYNFRSFRSYDGTCNENVT